MRFKIFQPTEQQYNALVNIFNDYYPMFPTHAAEIRSEDHNGRDKERHRHLLVEKDTLLGFGELSQTAWTEDPHNYTLEVFVKRDLQGQGLGNLIYRHIMQLPKRGSIETIESGSSTLIDRGSDFLINKGFRLATREHVSAINLTKWKFADHQDRVDLIKNRGIRLVSYAELPSLGIDKRELYDLLSTLDRDIPWHTAHNPETFEQWLHRRTADDRLMERCSFVALTEDQTLLGATELESRPNAPTFLYQGLTGVLPHHRQQGIAMALKTYSFQQTQSLLPSTTKIWTENEEHNPMYLLNKKLGFKQVFDWLYFQKKVDRMSRHEKMIISR